jgi:hypothetical protein
MLAPVLLALALLAAAVAYVAREPLALLLVLLLVVLAVTDLLTGKLSGSKGRGFR